ncbi:MAG: hypothetical protein ABIP61_09400, partial [Burkholderiaceae bacterium]
MPLPKPPAQRASLLSAADFESQPPAQPGKRAPPKARSAAEPAAPALLDLFDTTAVPGARPSPPVETAAL